MSRPDSMFRPAGPGTRDIHAQVTPARTGGKLVRTGNSTVRHVRRSAAEQGLLEPHSVEMVDGKRVVLWKAIDRAGDCMFPVTVMLHGRAASNPIHDIPWDDAYVRERTPEYQDQLVRCRRCDKCLAHRSDMWAARAMAELASGERNWFGTLTLSPASQDRALWAARKKFRDGGGHPKHRHFEDLPQADQFKERAAVIGEEITKYLKRIRKESAARLRYLLVTEAHKSGLPHFHMLLHEADGQVRKRSLDSQWSSLGFSHWRLVPATPDVAFYVSKYLAKSALTRVRASARYGRQTAILAEQLCAAAPL